MKDFGKEKMDMDGMRSKSASCSVSSKQEAQKFLSAMGSCAGEAQKGMQKKGFSMERDALKQGADSGVAECQKLRGNGLDEALTDSDEQLAKVGNKTGMHKRKTSSNGTSTLTGGLMREGTNRTNQSKPGNKELMGCLRKVKPDSVSKVACDIALEVVKTKYGCDLRGEEGIEAAMAGRDDITIQNWRQKGFGQANKYVMSCDTSTRVYGELQTKAAQCPANCTVEALKELAECRNEDASEVVEGTCSGDNKKMDKDSLKSEFPNCASNLETSLRKKRTHKKIKSSMKIDVSNKDEILNAGNEEAVKIAAARAIAEQVPGVTEDEINVISVTAATSRRMLSQRQGRQLAAGSVNITYEVLLNEDSTADESAIQNTLQNLNTDTTALQQGLTTALEEESIMGVTVTGATASTEVQTETLTSVPTTTTAAPTTTGTAVVGDPTPAASDSSMQFRGAALVVSALFALMQ